jgi:hypothetical protein
LGVSPLVSPPFDAPENSWKYRWPSREPSSKTCSPFTQSRTQSSATRSPRGGCMKSRPQHTKAAPPTINARPMVSVSISAILVGYEPADTLVTRYVVAHHLNLPEPACDASMTGRVLGVTPGRSLITSLTPSTRTSICPRRSDQSPAGVCFCSSLYSPGNAIRNETNRPRPRRIAASPRPYPPGCACQTVGAVVLISISSR